ncbi:hypothetical protein GCM10023144_01590 [Pigmentiphaga soli]|uniref:Single-stranded DNA-binding protein n=1 Tax=Pigmentiphaga soli TaxID=1007095 RepID=A0ABP8GCT9_9BURK
MYKLDTEAARGAESTGGRIAEKGKYKGKFTRAQHIVAESGTQGIEFDFVATSGQRARFSIYTLKADGKQIYGYKQLMAIMTCLSLRELADPKTVPAKVYDYDAGKEVDTHVPQFPELLGKPIGLLFSMEEYKPGKWRPNMAGAFNADTELVASEILERRGTPAKLAQMVLALRDRPYTGGESAPARAASSGQSGFADVDDDIPF